MLRVKVNEKEFEIREAADWNVLEQGNSFHIIKFFINLAEVFTSSFYTFSEKLSA